MFVILQHLLSDSQILSGVSALSSLLGWVILLYTILRKFMKGDKLNNYMYISKAV